MKTTHTPPMLCLYCGHTCNAASDFVSDAVPAPGDYSLCIACGNVMVFGDDMRLHKPTAKERRIAQRDPQVRKHQLVIKICQAKFPDWGKEKRTAGD